ncbi:autotransporter-associated N-terminal domain-containing protein, partial [Fusobacterium russii]|uniref:autotransporter-associated N-terminal domain-containing protein n=1 Tax=Fusobacterium russii TaxID=854 RepID=UPI0003B49CCE
MRNQIKKIENNLRYIAKRNKNITYSISLVLMYLMLGINAFSEEIKSVASKQDIGMSADRLSEVLNSIKAENEKKLKGANLELIQLIEQGNQVVKSPWSSWQFGMNYMYENWGGTYSGRGDKKEKYPFEGIFVRSNDIFERSTSPLSENYYNLEIDTNPYSATSSLRNGFGTSYGLASTANKQEPISTLNVDASVKPKDVYRALIPAPKVEISDPQLEVLSIPSLTPPDVSVPAPVVPEKEISIVQPNASPFTGFFFDGAANSISDLGNSASIVNDKVLYSGLEANSWKNGVVNIVPAAVTGYISEGVVHPATKTSTNQVVGRTTNILYRSGTTNSLPSGPVAVPLTLSNLTLHVRGYFNGTQSDGLTSGGLKDSYTDMGRGAAGGADPVGGPTLGTIGIHTLLDVNVNDTTANLYGRAGFLTSETWRNGTVTMNNTTVNMYGKQNTAFYIMPAAYGTIGYFLGGYWAGRNYYIGALKGNSNINMYGTGNNAYLSAGISGVRHIENDGIIQSEGASNIIYSGMGYVPTWDKTYFKNPQNMITKATINFAKVMKSVIKLNNSVNLYGDENVGLFFGSKMGGAEPKSWEIGHRDAESAAGYLRRASYIGIYQGEIELKANIGTQLAIDSNANLQTASGQLNSNGYTAKTVDGAVGIYVESGQRAGIVPTRDLGVPVNAAETGQHSHYNKMSTLDNDTIHALQVGKVDVSFGKYSKNGFMFISKLGSHIDVANPLTSTNYISGKSTEISDGINAANTSETDAATGTVIAYSEGTWDQAKHQLGSTAQHLADNNNKAAGSTAATLQGLGSVIDIHPNVILASKEGVAYMADNKGIVNAKGRTETVNYSSVIGFARNQGIVNITGDIEALDKNVTLLENKYKNIAGLATLDKNSLSTATDGGTVNITGNVNINGIGGLASGKSSVVNLNGINNIINTGTSGGLVAVNGGIVNFTGGILNHFEFKPSSHNSSTPFNADDSSHINFKGATTVNISHGILMPGKSKDYEAKDIGTAKYNGMENVTVNLTGNNVILATNNGETTNWTGNTSGS